MERLLNFYLDLVPESEIKEDSLLEARIEELRTYIKNDNPDISQFKTILDSVLDCTCLSIASGNLRASPTSFSPSVEDIENIGGNKGIKRTLNARESNAKPELFEERVRAWYSKHYTRTFPDLDDQYEGSVCEFAFDLKGVKAQMIECKRRVNSSEVDEESFKNWYREKLKESIGQFNKTEEKLKSLHKINRHLIIGVDDKGTGPWGTEEKIGELKGYPVEGCRDEDIEELKNWIHEVHKEDLKSGLDQIDQLTIVWRNYYRDEGVRKGITERTAKLFSNPLIKDYSGWNIFVHTLDKGDYHRFALHHEPKRDNWVVFGLDGDKKLAFSQQAAEKTKKEDK